MDAKTAANSQWGNLLVLDVARRDPILSSFVDESILPGLFSRTIDFLEVVSSESSSLKRDRRILRGLLEMMGTEMNRGANRSFSSATTGPPPHTPPGPMTPLLPGPPTPNEHGYIPGHGQQTPYGVEMVRSPDGTDGMARY